MECLQEKLVMAFLHEDIHTMSLEISRISLLLSGRSLSDIRISNLTKELAEFLRTFKHEGDATKLVLFPSGGESRLVLWALAYNPRWNIITPSLRVTLTTDAHRCLQQKARECNLCRQFLPLNHLQLKQESAHFIKYRGVYEQ